MSVNLPITQCMDCPHHATERYYTADSWEHIENLYCKRTDRPRPETTDRMPHIENSSRIAFLEFPQRDIAIPAWCPLRDV